MDLGLKIEQPPEEVTAYDLKSFAAHGCEFICGLCAKEFHVGDVCRWVDAKGQPPVGNFHVCKACDEGDEKCVEKVKANPSIKLCRPCMDDNPANCEKG